MNEIKFEISPIVLFVYNRPWHTQQTVEALQKNILASESELFIFSDGFKSELDKLKVLEVRKYIRGINGFKSVTIKESPVNKGLAHSIIDGVTEIVNKYERIIILEDDIVTSRCFLKYMNNALSFYQNDTDVISISAFTPTISKEVPEVFFLQRWTDCWGWGTWKRGWELFNKDADYLLKKIKESGSGKDFDFNGSYQYMDMLRSQVDSKTSSWAILWYASTFVNNKYTLCVRDSLVGHIGNDGSGTNCGKSNFLNVSVSDKEVDVTKAKKEDSLLVREEIEKYFKSFDPSFIRKTIYFSKKIFKKLFKYAYNILNQNKYGWFGDYKSWDEAKKLCAGYDSPEILEKCKFALLKVKNGEAVYERDSVLFDKIEYSWPLLSGLMLAASQNNGYLNVVDFGGSLGSTYYQNKKFLDLLTSVKWNIVEQNHFVETGKQYLEGDTLKFHYTIGEGIEPNKPNVLILSSVLQYLENPYQTLSKILKYAFTHVILDLTAISMNKERLTIQRVSPSIYKAEYPCWMLDYKKINECFIKHGFELLESFDVLTVYKVISKGQQIGKYIGEIRVKNDR